VLSIEVFHQWRIVFDRSNGAALVHAADDEDDDAEVGIPEDNWRYCDDAGVCENDETLRITVGKHPDTIKLSSTGTASEKYPDSLGEYQLLQDRYHNGFPVYMSLARDDRYIINIDYHWFITRNISDTAVREMRNERRGQGLVPELGWQYNNFPDCKTVR